MHASTNVNQWHRGKRGLMLTSLLVGLMVALWIARSLYSVQHENQSFLVRKTPPFILTLL